LKTHFKECGVGVDTQHPIQEITFPVFKDSGRSKGYCGVRFQSPVAVTAAVELLHGQELQGRWLSVQAGKMMLREWEEQHEQSQDQAKLSKRQAAAAAGDKEGEEEELGEQASVKRRKL
jgi:hypothetical protein